jgi:hypothetical protein
MVNVRKSVTLLIFIGLTLALSACHGSGGGGGGSGGGGGGGGGGVSVSFVPSATPLRVAAGASIPLAVTVSNSADISVTWTIREAGGGTVSLTGVYTAPATPGTYHIVATSNANPAASATETITVTSLALGAGNSYSGVFANISSMKNIRSNSTATLLATGRVLMAGGLGNGGASINKAEFFNPDAHAFGHFSSAGGMAKQRAYHAAVILMNGNVLLTGGIDNNNTPLTSSEIYNPATNAFTATGSMSTPRWMHSATLLASGKVLIVGGTSTTPFASSGIEGNSPLDSAELYDPVSGNFTPLNVNMVQPRYDHAATLLQNGKILLAGGQGRFGQKLPDTELFDPVAVSFTATSGNMMVDPTVDTGRWLFAALLLRDGTVFINGGDGGFIAGTPNYLATAQLFNPVTNSFTDMAGQMTYARAHHAAAMRVDGNILVTGGIGANVSNPNNIPPADFLNTAELFDTSVLGFSLTGNMITARANHTTTALANGKILVAGGNQGGVFLKSAEIYQ